jgi:hypothetical protein
MQAIANFPIMHVMDRQYNSQLSTINQIQVQYRNEGSSESAFYFQRISYKYLRFKTLTGIDS